MSLITSKDIFRNYENQKNFMPYIKFKNIKKSFTSIKIKAMIFNVLFVFAVKTLKGSRNGE